MAVAAGLLLILLAHLLNVLLHLRTLLRREYVHDLLHELLACLALSLGVGHAAFRMRLAELLHDLLDLRFLRIAQIHAAQRAHEAAVVALPLTVALAVGARRRRLRGLLREYRDGGYQGDAERRRKKKRTKGFHW